jgi:amino acid transporter
MAESPTAVAGSSFSPPSKLEPDAIGVAQDTIIGMASSAPAATVGLTLYSLASATAYASVPILLLTAIPMLIIANAYRRCNMWKANAGASFEWVGRAINPYLGYMTGWLMVVAYIVGTVAEILLLGPSVLAVFGSTSTNTWGWIAIGTAVCLIMLVIAIVGIRITARVQVGMAVVEYVILIGFSIWGLVAVLGHHPGTFPITSSWFSLSGVGAKGSAVAGFLVAVFVYGGWDGSLYVNEEVRQRRLNPGRAAVIAVALLTVLYTLAQMGLQGGVSPAKLAAASRSGTALIAVAQALGGGGWAKVMALSIALSVIATTGTGIVLSARIAYGMASYRALPAPLGTVSRRFNTPVIASAVVGVLLIAITWIYLLATSVQNAFSDVIDVTGLMFAIFYVLTALATIVYYRRRVFGGLTDFIVLGLLPLAAAVFLTWMFEDTVRSVPWAQRWSLIGVLALGLILMIGARVISRSPFFQLPRESDTAA